MRRGEVVLAALEMGNRLFIMLVHVASLPDPREQSMSSISMEVLDSLVGT
jgi:hypothetical protein